MKQIENLLPLAIGIYEFLSHVIPTKKNHSLLNKIFKGLSFLSGLLNREKPYTDSTMKLFTLALIFSFVFVSCKTLKNISCNSTKFVNVTFIAPDGYTYTLAVPYCDTVLVKNKSDIPDSLKNYPYGKRSL